MTNKNIILFSLLILITIFISGNNFNNVTSNKGPRETYSLVKINITSNDDIMKLQSNGITVEHYTGSLETGIEVVINQEEIQKLKMTAIPYEIKKADLDEYYANRELPTLEQMQPSKNILSENNIDGFSYGSMGGFYTYVEIVEKLDSMRLLYPNLISVKQSIGTTIENRQIWAVKISDNPDINESGSEPAIYFDALHHAREPQAMASMMYYMYWLLENYAASSEAAYLINNRQIYFVPVVNPDGYVYNQTTNPNGGGFWRKNRRNNGSGCYGVDLNRNYPYGWGDNTGSSSDPCDETFRGLSATSEPESQAIKTFTDQIDAKISFTMHSVAGRYLNPYGYNDSAINYEIYSEFSSDFAASNNYTYGTVNEMLNYYSSGTTRDYLHSQGTYCWTPEVGGGDFWPLQSQIIPVANENLYGMKYLSWVGGAYTDFLNYKISGKGYVLKNDTLNLQFTLKNRGLSQTALSPTVTVTPLYQNISPNALVVNFDPIPARQTGVSISPAKFFVTPAANYLDEIKFEIITKQEGVQTKRDTISIIVGKPNVLVNENAENGISQWTKSGTGILWDTTFIDPYDGSKNFADSRYGNSRNSSNNLFLLKDTINLSGTINPRIEFAAKWAEQVTSDYTRIQITTNFGVNWINLTGRYSTTVSGQPSYTGIKHWINERISLNNYIGQRIRIRFNLVTSNSVPGDGFYFDNFKIVNYIDTLTGVLQTSTEIPTQFSLNQNYPNPFNPATNISYSIPLTGNVKLIIYNTEGKEVRTLIDLIQTPGSYSVEFAGSDLTSGVYYYKLTAGNFTETKKMILIK